ncbi:MAG TPA: TrmH family RNA methyltransferase [Actinomycetota bacterium]
MERREGYRAARRDSSLAVLEGFHALKHAIRFGAELLDVVASEDAPLDELAADLAPDVAGRLRAVERIPAEGFAELTPTPPATGIAALARRPPVDVAAVLGDPGPAPVVFLEKPRRLENVGAVVRVAAAASAAGVLSSGPHDPWHPAAVRGSAGLHFAVPVARVDALPASDRPLVALDPEGIELGPGVLPPRAVAAFGTERVGLGREILRRADLRVRIPMREGVSSLNLATAVAVVLYTR